MVAVHNEFKASSMTLPAALLLTIAISLPVRGAENLQAWPRFRGPNGSGIAVDEKPPIDIGPDKNVKWKVPAHAGLSSRFIVGDKLVLPALDKGELYTIASRRSDGGEAWRAQAPARQLEPHHATEGSPAA